MLQVLDDEMVVGGIIITVAAALSLFFLMLMLLHIFLALVLPAYAQRMSNPQERKFIMSPLGLYITCLFASNIISALGGVMQPLWVDARAITQGPACSSQAFMLQLGSNATALWIGVISVSALRTFLFRARSLSRTATLLLVCALWIALIIFDALASTFFADHSGNFFYGIAFMWCWITPSYRAARLSTQYIWMWLWSLVSAVCFLLVFLSVRGNIAIKRDGTGRSVKWSKRASNLCAVENGDQQYGTLVGTVGKTMCWFPIIYISLTLPISVTGVLETFGFQIPVYAFVVSAVCSFMLGIGFLTLYVAICHSLTHGSAGVYSNATLCGDTLGSESFYNTREARLLPVSKLSSYSWAPTSSTRECVLPSQHWDVNEATSTSSTMIGGGEERISAYRGNNAPSSRLSVSSQLAPRGQSFHRPMDSTSTVTSLETVVGPVHFSSVFEGKSVTEPIKSQITVPPAAIIAHRQPQQLNIDLPASGPTHKYPSTDASKYSEPHAISSDLNALLLASQTPTSPSGPPPPPRKMRRMPIPSVPVDVDESDQGSILSALPSIEVFDTRDVRRPDSTLNFWATHEGRGPMTPNMPFSANAALKHDTARNLWGDYEDRSPTTADTSLTSDISYFRRGSGLESSVISPVSPQFQPGPSVSRRPSTSAVGRTRMNMSPLGSPRVMGNLRLMRSSSTMPASPQAVLYSGTATRLRPSYSATARLNESYTQRTLPPTSSEVSTDKNYRTPRPQPGFV